MLNNRLTKNILRVFVINLILCFSLQNTFASEELPKGEDYPTDNIYSGKSAKNLDKSDEFTNAFRSRFKEAIQGNVVFAGEFAQAEWGCGGSGCHVIAFINKRTGRALNHSFMVYDAGDNNNQKLIGEDIVYMNKGSDLIVTLEASESSEDKYYNYYTLSTQKNDLTLIKKIKQ